MIPAAALFFLMLAMPESPRWNLLQAHLEYDKEKRSEYYDNAFNALARLRHTKLQAGRDLFYLQRLLQIELSRVMSLRQHYREIRISGAKKVKAHLVATVRKYRVLVSNDRCRRALHAALIVMIAQQLCGVNVCPV